MLDWLVGEIPAWKAIWREAQGLHVGWPGGGSLAGKLVKGKRAEGFIAAVGEKKQFFRLPVASEAREPSPCFGSKRIVPLLPPLWKHPCFLKLARVSKIIYH